MASERKRPKFDFEQRQRLEAEIVPACVDDPEYAGVEILRLEIERDEERLKIAAALVLHGDLDGICKHDGYQWPCHTVRALRGGDDGE